MSSQLNWRPGARFLQALCLSLVLLLMALAVFSRQNRLRVRHWAEIIGDPSHNLKTGDVLIPKGEVVLLDATNPTRLHRLIIEGTLIVDDSRDIRLEAGEIQISGTLQIGTSAKPFQHKAIITLTGDQTASRMISVTGGSLELHGGDSGITWTRLVRSTEKGANKIEIEKPSGWRVDDVLVLASTDFDAHQAETRRITRIDGTTVTLDSPLNYSHWGQVVNQVDERGEVGLLTRNIVLQGDARAPETGNGGCVMVMRGGNAHIANTEFRNLGVLGQKGHYPLHFHLAGNLSGAYVKDCSIHHCYNRSLTIHGTHHIQVENNVAFDTIGHSYFLEDGLETKNTFTGNLGILTRAASPDKAILPSDLTPATYWITNPDNTFRNNVAAGSEYYGFWFSFPKHPTGPSESKENNKNIWPRRTPLGTFTGNAAHSNEHDGLFVDNGPNPPGVTETPTYDPKQFPVARKGPQDSPPAPANFDDFTAYKNRRRGIWLRGSYLRVRRARLADNSIGVTLASSDSRLENSRIVGETINQGQAAPQETTGSDGRTLPKPDEPKTPICGFEFYDGLVSVHDVSFVNFTSNSQRKAGAFSCLRFSPFFVDPRNFIEGASFDKANAVYLETKGEPGNPDLSGDGYRSAVFMDRDGTVTGKPQRSIVVNNPLLINDRCTYRQDWNASVCNNAYGRLFIDNKDSVPQEVGPVRIQRKSTDANQYGSPFRLFGSPKEGANTSFQTSVIANEEYAIAFEKQAPRHFRLTLRHREQGDWVIVRLSDTPDLRFAFDRFDHSRPLSEVSSREALQTASRQCIFRDPEKGTQYIKLQMPDKNSRNQNASVDICASEACH
jgi:hypothetical protein